jgi:hypothetical protein
MTARAGAAIGLRIIAVWIFLQAVFYLISSLFMIQYGAPLQQHSLPSAAATVLAPTTPRTYGPQFTYSPLRSMAPYIAARFLAAFVLFFASGPLGRVFAREVE